MVNIIGVPVMLIGTPKAREIFEADLRSARRGAGFGALFWDPMEQMHDGRMNNEWVAFTNNLRSEERRVGKECRCRSSTEYCDGREVKSTLGVCGNHLI